MNKRPLPGRARLPTAEHCSAGESNMKNNPTSNKTTKCITVTMTLEFDDRGIDLGEELIRRRLDFLLGESNKADGPESGILAVDKIVIGNPTVVVDISGGLFHSAACQVPMNVIAVDSDDFEGFNHHLPDRLYHEKQYKAWVGAQDADVAASYVERVIDCCNDETLAIPERKPAD